MTTVFRTRQRAEDFAALVEGTLRTSSGVPDGERLLAAVATLRRQVDTDPAASPRTDFSLGLRERLMTEADTVLAGRSEHGQSGHGQSRRGRPEQTASLPLPVRRRGRRERQLVAAATAVILFGGTAGMASASQDALPGEALYPVKRGFEQVDVQLSGTATDRGRDLLHQASERLHEVHGLMETGTAAGAAHIPATLDLFATQARQGTKLLLDAYADDRNPAAITSVRQFAARDLQVLEDLSADAPSYVQSGLRDGALMLRDIHAEATRVCVGCQDGPPLVVPEVLLSSADVDPAADATTVPGTVDESQPVVVTVDPLIRFTPPPDSAGDPVYPLVPGAPASPAAPAPVPQQDKPSTEPPPSTGQPDAPVVPYPGSGTPSDPGTPSNPATPADPGPTAPSTPADPGTPTPDPGTPDPGTSTPDPGTSTPDPGTSTPDPGTSTPDPGTSTPDPSTPPDAGTPSAPVTPEVGTPPAADDAADATRPTERSSGEPNG
jgi:hypothetical protein